MKLNNRAFTTVEAIVASILMIIIGGGIFTLLTLQTRHSRNGYGYAELQIRAETVIDALEIPTRRGTMLTTGSELFSTVPVNYSDIVVDSFTIFNSTGVINSRFRVENGSLEEFIAGNWSDVGVSPVPFSSATLTLAADRKSLTYSFDFTGLAFRDSLFTLTRTGGVGCRN